MSLTYRRTYRLQSGEEMAMEATTVLGPQEQEQEQERETRDRGLRFGPLYPGDAPVCANGCHDFPQVEVMPAEYPPGGWLGTCCATCGWMCQFHLRHGDRDTDVYWVVDEDVPEDCARRMRTHTLALLRRHGYPRPAWADSLLGEDDDAD